MRVLVTGGTGFVGAWSAKALADAGHRVRFLVRDPAGLAASVGTLGVDTSDYVVGDITDVESVRRALDGCESVLHCAAVVATDPRRAEEMHATNLKGAKAVLGTAAELGLDPIIHTSSITALFVPGIETMSADLDVGEAGDAYGRSKSAVEEYARGLQASGAPVTITYPGMVLGPGAGERFGEVADGLETILTGRVVPGSDAGWLVIDVRDLAAVHAALLVPGRDPERYMVGGTYITAKELTALIEQVTGRRLVRLPIPGVGLRLLGTLVDAVTGLTGQQAVLTRAAMEYYTQMPASDDSAVHQRLGVTYRPLEDTFRDCIRSLVACGRIPAVAGGQ